MNRENHAYTEDLFSYPKPPSLDRSANKKNQD